MKHFLLDYNRATQKLVSITTFEDMDEALAAYSEREGAALGTEHEIVLSAPSPSTICGRRTDGISTASAKCGSALSAAQGNV